MHSLKTADSRITELCNELASLTVFLEAVERTLKGCHPLDTAHVNEELWHQSELCLVDCQVTLNELAVLVDKIKCSNNTRRFGWRLRAVVDLSVYSPDIGIFRDKIHKSTWALQTLLHTITVSLSLRQNASQDMILFELDRLKVSIDEALLASRQPRQRFSHSLSADSRLARNLRNLAEAARHFHSAASSTASTIRDHSGSLLGDFPPHRRERVETFIRTAGRHASGHETPATVISTSANSASIAISPRSLRVTASASRWPAVEDDEDDESEFEKLFLEGLEDLAKDSIRRKEFEKAIAFLTEAIQRKEKARSGKGDLPRLQAQLALCYLFGDDWKQAEPIVSALVNHKEAFSDLGPVVWTMLHALALAYLSTYAFEGALETCKRAFHAQGKWARTKQLDRRDVEGSVETTALLATIFHMEGDYIAAEIYRRQLPEDFVYNHCSDPREFLASQFDLVGDVLGDDLSDLCDYSPLSNSPDFQQLRINTRPSMHVSIQRLTALHRTLTVNAGDLSPLRARHRQWEKFEMDTNKEVVVSTSDTVVETETSDEAATRDSNSPRNTAVASGFRRRATKMFETGRGLHRTWCRWSAEADSAASSTPSPIRRWLKGTSILVAKPARAMLRRRSDSDTKLADYARWEGPKTFRGLPISRPIIADSSEWWPTFRLPVGHPGTILDDHVIPDTAREGYTTPENTADDETSVTTTHNSVSCTDTFQDRGSETDPETSEVPEQPVTPHTANIPRSSCPAELMDTSFSVTSQQKAFNQVDVLDVLLDYLQTPQEQSAQPSYDKGEIQRLDSPTVNNYSRPIAPESRPRFGTAHDSDTPRTTTVIEEANRKNATREAGHLWMNTGSKKMRKPGTTLHRGHDRLEPKFAKGREKPRYGPTTTALSQEETAVLSKLADILASLTTRKDLKADKLHAAKLELEALSAYLEKWGTDSTLCRDVRNVIESLPGHLGDPAEWSELQDSGYSSVGSGSSETLSSSDATSPVSDHVSGDSEPQVTGHMDGMKPEHREPKRRLSEMARDGAADRPKLGSSQHPKPHANGSRVMSAGPNRARWRRTGDYLPERGGYGKDKETTEQHLAAANSDIKPGAAVSLTYAPGDPDLGTFF
ncbi:uncharacterized protein B0H64DRAFT_220023 [Chaetomium fimeti]|uniref:Uncharacterized protein n=1 Tax=Chaetomium fimeti TaxID=1854472 RepID=A0AAE0H8S1_9PEZI|nr:hypothetical protein B0H64DRAFT_220023 [Chaetomium fimeti]